MSVIITLCWQQSKVPHISCKMKHYKTTYSIIKIKLVHQMSHASFILPDFYLTNYTLLRIMKSTLIVSVLCHDTKIVQIVAQHLFFYSSPNKSVQHMHSRCIYIRVNKNMLTEQSTAKENCRNRMWHFVSLHCICSHCCWEKKVLTCGLSAYFLIEVVTITIRIVWPGGQWAFWNGKHVTLCQIVVSYAENRVQCI